jgi:P22 tail accessory factor
MAWTKKQVIKQAYEELGIASYEFDVSPEEMQTGLRILDLLMAEWNIHGIRVSYNSGDDIAAQTGVPDWAVNALFLTLAVRLAPSLGKTPAAETKAAQKSAYSVLMAKMVAPTKISPAGYGGSGSRYPNLRGAAALIETGPDGNLGIGLE